MKQTHSHVLVGAMGLSPQGRREACRQKTRRRRRESCRQQSRNGLQPHTQVDVCGEKPEQVLNQWLREIRLTSESDEDDHGDVGYGEKPEEQPALDDCRRPPTAGRRGRAILGHHATGRNKANERSPSQARQGLNKESASARSSSRAGHLHRKRFIRPRAVRPLA